MNSILKLIIKILGAGIVAFFVLSLFSAVYYNMPIRIKSSTYSTDYVWEHNALRISCGEGFSYGVTDSNGYNNKEVPEKINVLVMGSSQMEGFNVLPDQNTTYKLNEAFDNNEMTAYNIGISGHNLLTCINNLENAVSEFSPKDYVIIETQDIAFNPNDMINVINGDYGRTTASDGKDFMYYLQKFDYFRLLYSQFKSYRNNNSKKVIQSKQNILNEIEYKKLLDVLIKKAKKDVGERKLIIFYQHALNVDSDNNIKTDDDFYYMAFEEACKNNDVVFINMNEYFSKYYIENHKFPHGFSNTRIGTGHLNKYGHAVIANVLYDKIMDMEEK